MSRLVPRMTLAFVVGLVAWPALVRGAESKDAEKKPAPLSLKVTLDTVDTASGKVRGLILGEDEDVACFKGIPYAAPPVGDLRWKEPQPVAAWSGTRECFEFGPCCVQKTSPMLSMPGMALGAPMSEDCLYLNVWTPAKKPAEPLPVMVWIHGGGYLWGSGSQAMYDGADLARRGVVAVTINYRLGLLGFMAHPLLTAESEHKASGNYGLLDQIAALRWVQQNIANFGGDPKRVTIFGESAGGGSVFSLIASPLAAGLFHRAIAQSGPTLNFAHLNKTRYGQPAAEQEGIAYAKSIGIEDSADALRQLREAPAEKLLTATPDMEGSGGFSIRGNGLRLAPIVDGYAIPDDPMTLYAEGKINAVPLVVGSNKDEATLFTMMIPMPKTPDAVNEILDREFGAQAARVRELYPASKPAEIRKAVTELAGDFIFGAPARFVARNVAKAKAPVYWYHFAHRPPAPTGPMFGAHHGAEIAYALDNIDIAPGARPSDIKVRDTLHGFWVQFAKTGNPNGEGLPSWPAYTTDGEECLTIAETCEVTPKLRKDYFDVIDEFMEAWGKE